MRAGIVVVCSVITALPCAGLTAEPDPTEVTVLGARGTSDAGTKSDTPLAETPQSITVISRDTLDLLGVTDLDQALRYVAGAAPDTRGGSGSRYDLVNLRGFAPDQYLDGLKVVGSANGYAVPQIDVSRLDRIEVVKGPASVLYGQASPGGIIALSSKLPQDRDFFGQIEAIGGSFGTAQLDADIGGALNAAHTLLFRVDGVVERSDTVIARTESQRIGISPSVSWRPDAQTSWTVLYSYQRDPKNGSYGALPQQGTVLPNPNGPIARDFNSTEPGYERYARTDNAVTSLFSRTLWPGWTIRQNTRYEALSTYYRSVYSFSIDPDLRSIPRFADVANERLHNLAADTQLAGSLRTGPVSHGLLFGTDFQHTGQTEAAGFAGSASTLDLYNPVYGLPVTDSPITFNVRLRQNQTGVYAQDQMAWQQLRLMLSGRYDWVDQSQLDRLSGSVAKLDQSKFTGRAGLLYQAPFGISPYISYSTSFQPQTATDRNGQVLAPTAGKQAEIGVKYQPGFWNTLLTASLYDLRQTNVATQDPTAAPGLSIAAGEIRSQGLELEAHVRPVPQLVLNAAFTTLDNTVSKDNSGLLGAHPYGVPRDSASAYGVYSWQAGPLAGLGLGGGVRHIGKSFNGVVGASQVTVPDTTLFDLIGTYDFAALRPSLKGLTLDVNVRNLFNRRYVNACYGTIWCWYGDRTDAQAALRYRW